MKMNLDFKKILPTDTLTIWLGIVLNTMECACVLSQFPVGKKILYGQVNVREVLIFNIVLHPKPSALNSQCVSS
jgi:hypothetical protein